MRTCLFLFVIALTFASCGDDTTVEHPGTPVDLTVQRFDLAFAKAQPAQLTSLKQQYPKFFPASVPDSIWVSRMTDTIQQEINREVDKVFPDFTEYELHLEQLVGNIQAYVPDFLTPRVVTTTNRVDWKYRCIVTDDTVVLSLDNYLGTDHFFYEGMPRYIQQTLSPDFLVTDVAQGVARNLVAPVQDNALLSHMIYWGKVRYLQQLWMPAATDAQIMTYTDEQMQWAVANEDQVYRYLIDRELLFETDPSLPKRFTEIAPFTKFYLELDQQSPGRLGQYVGWNMVRQYMDRNDVTWKQLLQTPAQTILKDSRYKPQRP